MRLSVKVITPYSWGRSLRAPVFAPRIVLRRVSGTASLLWYRRWHEAFLQRALTKFLAGVGPLVVYAQDPLAARAALRARRGPEQRVVLAVHFSGSEAEEWADNGRIGRDGFAYRAVQEQEREVLPNLDGLVFTSESGRELLLHNVSGAASVPSVVIPPFVKLPPLAPVQEPLADLVTAGRLVTLKNHAYLLDVLLSVAQQGQKLTMDIYGEGSQRGSLEGQARQYGLQSQVRLQGFDPDFQTKLSRYRVYVHASLREFCPVAVLEAMAAGLPVIAGDVGGIGEVLRNGRDGRLWPLDDPDRAAAVLVEVLADDGRRRRMGESARDRLGSSFSEDAVAPRLTDWLLRL